MRRNVWLVAAAVAVAGSNLPAAEPLAQDWPYAAAMRKVAATGTGRPGVVLHVGDSITYSNPYGQWARGGQGKLPDDAAALNWMHAGADDDSDGWFLARFDHPDGGRSHTACGGLRVDELLSGGKQNLPALERLLDQYRPQAVVLLIGTNDVTADRPVERYQADLVRALDLMLTRGVVPLASTIPPHPRRPRLAEDYNRAIREAARARSLPLVDFEREILTRRPRNWNGTLLGTDDVHPTASREGVTAASAPTDENLRQSGYLLRGWLSVRKLGELKREIFDRLPPAEKSPPKPAGSRTIPRPQGTPLRAPVTRDTYFSNVGREADGNLGGSRRLKIKSIQEMSLVDLDPAPLRGRVIAGATLHLHATLLKRVTVGSISSEWSEGTSHDYQPQVGSSTFRHRRHPDLPWTRAGGDLCAVMLGQGGTLWRTADSWPADQRGWQRVAVDPRVVAARVAGVSRGFVVFDDTGTEWQRQAERFTRQLYPNRFIDSRESGAATAPYFTIYLGEEDRQPPEVPSALTSTSDGLPPGEAIVRWTTPADAGAAGVVGFHASLGGQPLPQYLVPLAGAPGQSVEMHLADLDLPAETIQVDLELRAADGAGNIGPPARAAVALSRRSAVPWPAAAPMPAANSGQLPKLAGAEVAIIDMLDKVHPLSGALTPAEPDSYLLGNHLWSSAPPQIRLAAGRNEFVGFQIVLRGQVADVQPAVQFADPRVARARFFRYANVSTRRGPLPDPLPPLTGGFSMPDRRSPLAGQTSGSLLCELYVPHDAPAGEQRGALTLRAAGQTLEIPLRLAVWNFTLPDELSFLPEMNCYDLPAQERDYYRMAHEHRTVLNRVPYYQSGQVAAGCAPEWDGRRLDWQAWDRRFGQYFDGTAFRDLPRAGVPIECWYLPIHENWPTAIEPHYNGDYWADRAFTPDYRRALVEAARQFAAHLEERHWRGTLFHLFFNGKHDFKERGWSRGSSPWLLDEPANFQDYWALRYFGQALREGAAAAAGQSRLLFRCDISRPQWQRDALDDVLDYNVVGASAFRQYRALVLERKRRLGQRVIEYGTAAAIEHSALQPVAWAIDSWSLGSDGILPWQTLGTANSWNVADELSLFYPPRAGSGPPVASLRLKAFRRGQQDVEYLTLWAQSAGQPRWAVAEQLRRKLSLRGRTDDSGSVGGEDAGRLDFQRIRSGDLHALRTQIGAALSALAPPPRRRLVEWPAPRRAAGKPDDGYVTVGDVPEQPAR